MSDQAPNQARVIPLRPPAARPGHTAAPAARPAAAREPLWRDLVGDVLRRERQAQERTLKDVADSARISMPYLSEVERGRKEASSEVLAAAAHALGLSLGDLLGRAQGELIRLSSRHSGRSHPNRSRTTTSSSYDGLCLAA
ncbi:Transcriptional regulator, contains XRE-family HTH domain [Streptomyces sp. yr375]|uniref:helix-turn-helix domain-containing protein n=1 Tax=Streptomyces sp. yr375 TaxID=1761906 RepID=UPI0008D670E7|nr:helix-turn-helix transcriptional regulator [Streptomyces sp. yr375]SES42808.1 Transcriptional regulator, contains XRE-family HTH domain [Streptomyces sp. yr375]